MKRWIFKVIACLILVLTGCVCLINYAFEHKKYGDKNLPINALWMHRGLYNNKTTFENTIAAFDSARKMKIKGIELDIHYVEAINDFVVTHDLPNAWSLPELKLSTVIERYDTAFSYWFDLKNLTNENRELIAARLHQLLSQRLVKKVFIESGNAAPLGYLAESGFYTIYWIQYGRSNIFTKMIKKFFIRWNFVRYKFAGGSSGATLADEDFFKEFEPVPKFIFHIYTPEIFEPLKKRKNVAVYLMDYIPTTTE